MEHSGILLVSLDLSLRPMLNTQKRNRQALEKPYPKGWDAVKSIGRMSNMRQSFGLSSTKGP